MLSPAEAAGSTSHRQLSGSVPSWANSAHKVGATSGSTQVDFRVYLDYRGGNAAASYAKAVSTPGSASYGKFLSPAQFRAKFAPSTTQVNAVKTWLRGQGFKLGTVPANHKYVEATGTVARAAKSFSTSFAQYKVQGHTVRANNRPLTIPSSLKGVQAVVGLDESQTLVVSHKVVPPAPGFRNAPPCSTYWGEKTISNTPTTDGTTLPTDPDYAFAPCGYAGAQLQGAYGMSGAIANGNDGTGVTVGIIDAYASPYIVQDVNKYSSLHGLPQLDGHFTQVTPPGTYQRAVNSKQDPQGWAGEETLDVEAVHTMAPGADIVYIGAPNNYRDMDAIMNRVVDNHLADIVTNSYGYGGEALPRGYIKPQVDTQIQAAAEGISLFFSSGDSGDETGGDSTVAPTPDWPASSPWVTAVGGTSLGVSKDNTRVFELGWETGKRSLQKDGTWSDPAYQYGGGGGTSRLFTQPDYQKGVVPGSMSQTYGGAAMRVVPDVAAVGDPTTGMLVGQTQTFPDGAYYDEYRLGGTSLASPLYAGMFALAVQKAGHNFGLANPALYNTRGGASLDITKDALGTYPGAVRADYVNTVDKADGISYSVRLFDYDTPLTIHVAKNYDDVTGIGVPTGEAWLDALAAQ